MAEASPINAFAKGNPMLEKPPPHQCESAPKWDPSWNQSKILKLLGKLV
jgi:hypothetical protein